MQTEWGPGARNDGLEELASELERLGWDPSRNPFSLEDLEWLARTGLVQRWSVKPVGGRSWSSTGSRLSAAGWSPSKGESLNRVAEHARRAEPQ